MAVPISYLRDDFADGIQAPAWSASFVAASGTKAETSGQARLTLPNATAGSHFAFYRTSGAYNLTGDAAVWNIDTMISTAVVAQASFDLYLDGSNLLRWRQLSGTLTARTIVGGVDTQLYTVAWNATTHKYLRIRESGGTIFFDTSTNGTTWTNRASVANPFVVTALFIQFGATCGNVANPGSLRVEDFNLILPALATNWRHGTVEWPYLERFRVVTLASTSGQGYIATASEATSRNADGTPNVLASPRYFSGPLGSSAGNYNQLTEYASQAAAEAMAVNLPLDGRWDLPSIVECRIIRLYRRSTTGSPFDLREYYPRRLVQTDDLEAESVDTINLRAQAVTADKLFVLDLSAITANIGQLTLTNSTGAAAWLYQGTGTGDAPSTGLKLFNSGGIGKLSGYNATVEQATFDTDGRIKAGAGLVVLDVNGVTIEAPSSSSYNAVSAIDWHNTANNVDIARIYGWYDNVVNVNHFNIEANRSGTTRPGQINIAATGWFGVSSSASIDIYGGTAALQSYIDLNALHTDVSGTLNAESGLNVGGATGALPGEIRATDKLRLNAVTGHSMQMRLISVANNAVAQLCNNATETGLVLIVDASGATSMFALTGGGHGVAEMSDPFGQFSVTAGTAASSNVYWSAGNSRYEIENKRGSTIAYQMYLFVNS